MGKSKGTKGKHCAPGGGRLLQHTTMFNIDGKDEGDRGNTQEAFEIAAAENYFKYKKTFNRGDRDRVNEGTPN